MVDPIALVGLLVLVGINTLLAAVATRFFRVRLESRWGTVVYVALFVPLLLVASTLLISGVFRLGAGLGSRQAGLVVAFVLPLVLGIAVDLFWMPHPDDIELPDTTDGSGVTDSPDERGTE